MIALVQRVMNAICRMSNRIHCDDAEREGVSLT